jgi:hypothetical protein
MRKLTVKNFSVIKEAELEFGKITVLIGPPSSGKSLLCKLTYFLEAQVIVIAVESLLNGNPWTDFVRAAARDFNTWFSTDGWLRRNSKATFSSQKYTVEICGPYILSAFNNLIYAGQLAKEKPELKDEIAKMVPEHFWIENGNFRAYCIHDGQLKSILSESGLINGDYLDSVSETIGNEFDSLLRLEYDHTEAS